MISTKTTGVNPSIETRAELIKTIIEHTWQRWR